MVKKLLTLVLGLAIAAGLSAQTESTIDKADILYWVGEGESEAIFVLDDGTDAVAWGFRFDESDALSLQDMVNAIDAADPRLSYALSYVSYSYNIFYTATPVVMSFDEEEFSFKVNGELASSMDYLEDVDLEDGMLVKVSDSEDDIWSTPIVPVSVLTTPVDASFAKEGIQYWVGSGANEAVVAISWSSSDRAYAWGIRWDGTLRVDSALARIVAADPRLDGEINSGFSFSGSCPVLEFAPGGYSQYYVDANTWTGASTTLNNGSFVKIGESNYAVGVDSNDAWGYGLYPAYVVWTTPVVAVGDPSDATDACIASSDILYWVGEGNDKAIMIVSWADTALAWGVRFDGSTTAAQMMDAVAAADWRFSYDGGAFVNDIYFYDGKADLKRTGFYWLSVTNSVSNWGMSSVIMPGDVLKWGDAAGAVVVDSSWVEDWGGYWDYVNVWPTAVNPASDPSLQNSVINPDKIEMWAGNGSKSVVLVVDWADTTLAWGYRFTGDSVAVADVMNAVADYDSRFSYSGSPYISDIRFALSANDTLGITPGNYFSGLLNGSSWNSGLGAKMVDGDQYKWADPASGIVVDSSVYDGITYYDYVWSNNIYPATVPQVPGEFCGAVGTEGCDAIAADSSIIKAWATGCTVTRGPQNIADAASPLVTYGTDDMATGAVDKNDNLTVVSLGDGGSAVLTFAKPIKNGPGPDFAVFENSFDDNFLELAFVEVSSDGETFFRFPAVSLTQTVVQTSGMGSTDPTMLNNLAGKYRMGYGTPFDLDELKGTAGLDVDNITHVRLVDVVGSINPLYGTLDSRGNLINDPWPTDSYSSGFDLAGVAVINQNGEGIDDVAGAAVSVWPNPATDRLHVSAAQGTHAELYDAMGRSVMAFTLGNATATVDVSALPAGVYMLRVGNAVRKVVKR